MRMARGLSLPSKTIKGVALPTNIPGFREDALGSLIIWGGYVASEIVLYPAEACLDCFCTERLNVCYTHLKL
jgi:hypothetical protein